MIKIVFIIILIVNLYSERAGENLYTFKEMKKEYSDFKPDIKELKDGRFRAKFYRCGGKLNSLGYIFEEDKNCNIKILEDDIEFNSKGLQDSERISYHVYPNISKKPIKTVVSHSKNGLREGTSILYDPKGRVNSYSEYKNDKQDGLSVNYNALTEKLIKVETYKNGKLNGPNTTYYPNGKVDMSRVYKDNIYWYPAKFYYKSGNLKKYIKYVKDLNITIAYVYKDSDKKEIIKTEYYDFGRNLIKKAYDPGKVITKKEYEKLKSSSK